MNTQDIKLGVVADKLVDLTLSAANAQRLLLGSLAAHLIDKGVINQDEYIEHTLDVKEHLLENKTFNDDREKLILESIFDLHINDFKKE